MRRRANNVVMLVNYCERIFRRSHFINVTVLVFLTSALYLPGLFSLPVVDRDEARFAQATRQMVEGGGYFHIRFQDEVRHKKPPGIYHVQAVVVEAARWLSGDDDVVDSILWYRVPSFVGAMLAVLLVYGFAVYYFDDKVVSVLAAGLLASSVLLVTEAHQATTDAVLCAAMTGVMGALGGLYVLRGEGRRSVFVVLFWLMLALGFYVKGPIAVLIPLVCLLSLSAWDRDWGLVGILCSWWGMGLFVVATACWAVPLHIATGGAFWRDALFGDFLPKLQSGVESHSFLPGFYTVLVVVTFWPGSIVAGWALVRAWSLMRGDYGGDGGEGGVKARAVRFLFAWLLPMWVILELTPTRLPHYVLPLYPALAILTAVGVCGFRNGDEGEGCGGGSGGGGAENGGIVATLGMKMGFIFWGFVTLGMGSAIVFVLYYLQWSFTWVIGPVLLGFLCAGIMSVWLACRGRLYGACVIGILCCVVIMVFLWSQVLPSVDDIWVSRSVARVLRGERGGEGEGSEGSEVVVVGYREPSLVFVIGSDIRFMSARRAAADCAGDGNIVVLVTKDREDVFISALREMGYRADVNRDAVVGYNYSNGKWVSMSILRGFVKGE